MVQRNSRAHPAFYRGEEGRRRAEDELVKDKQRQAARKEAMNAPFRFRISPDSTTQFIVVDDAPDFFRFEHNLKNPQTGKWDIFTGCVNEWDNCPVCEASGSKEPYYAMYLTVIDLTPFETKDGTTHEFSRKLLVVKPAQQKKFHRMYNKFAADGLSLRGALFEVTRDTEKDSAIGNEIEYLEHVSEDELGEYVREWTDRDKKRHTEDCSEPYDYEKLFEAPDTEKLRAIVGGRPTAGSRQADRDALGDGAASRTRPGASRRRAADDDDSQDADGWQKPATGERMGARRGATRGASDDHGTDNADDDAGATSRRVARGAVGASEDRPARTMPARPGAGRAAAGRGRSDNDNSPPFDQDDPEGEASPTRPRGRRLAR